MLIWSFALSGHSIVLDLLIAGSEMLLLLFHMDGYRAKGQGGGGGGGTGKRPNHCHGSKIKDCLRDDGEAVKANGRMEIQGAALP